MRVVFSFIAFTLATGVAAEPPAPGPSIQPSHSPRATAEGRVPCRDTIHEVREARGLPPLDPGGVASQPPQLVAAIDHRIDGCSVMVIYNNTSDVRPLPAMPDGPPRLQRIPGG